jgi:hypothetical protein
MEPVLSKIAGFLVSASAAALAAFTLGYIAHYDLGLSRQEIRTPALIVAIMIALLLATEYFGKKLRKPK